MNPLFEGPLGPQRLEHLNIKDFPAYQKWKEDWINAGLLTDGGVIPDVVDPRTDLIHPFTD